MKNIGRVKLIVRKKEGECGYPPCPRKRKIEPGDKVFLVSRGGTLPDKSFAIFYTIFHKKCIGMWMEWKYDNTAMQDGGRPKSELDIETKRLRKSRVHERAKLIRQLRVNQDPLRVEKIIGRIQLLADKINDTGVPIQKYTGRRSSNDLKFDKFVHQMKDRWNSPTDIKRRLETQVEWATEQLANNGIVGKEAAIESVLVEWQEDTDRRLETDRMKTPSYEEVEERKLE